ncbi:MAG: potassium channel family protein [Gemmatimonadetes bacterium]|nr:potassium channel family protein [Gemmatimonadota bacterium]
MRSRRVERYLTVWITLESLLLASFALGLAVPHGVTAALAVIRIVDILQAVVNLMVFDQLRTPQTLIISSAVRTLVLSMINYLELIICFAILYESMPHQLAGANDWTDALYFSVVTQLTIGYGDVTPIGPAKAVAAVQALFTFAFTVLLLGRIITVLPRIESVMRETPEE